MLLLIMNINSQKEKVEAEIKKSETMGKGLGKKVLGIRDSAFNRYPLVFVFLSTFGLVATFYGFEKVIDNVPFFSENPYMVLVTGIAILIFTGTLYKKLS